MNETARLVQEQLANGEESQTNAVIIGKIIEKDLGLSAKILKIANSVFYSGKYGQIGNVGQAVARLGIDEVSHICTAVSSIQLFNDTSGMLDLKDFWKHSLGVAIVMRHIADRAEHMKKYSPNAYTAGLFHDIGILILDRYYSNIYKVVLETAKKEPLSLFEIEKNVLGIDHGELGALLCKKWKLPEEICLSVEYHHAPDACREDFRLLAQLIHVANFACSILGIPEPGDNAIQMASHGAWHDLGLDNCDLNKIAEDVEEGITRSGVFMSLSL
jgi:putative nucleotidyltransferase with HDIG domain